MLEYYLATIALFVVAKVAFMLVCGEGLTLGDYTAVVWHGLSLDLSTALYFFGVPYLLTMLSLWVRVPRIAYLIYYGFVAVVFSLVFVADTSLYSFWHFKLDASCLLYLETPAEAMAAATLALGTPSTVRIAMMIRLIIYLAICYISLLPKNMICITKNYATVPFYR